MNAGGDRSVRGPRHRAAISQTRTPALEQPMPQVALTSGGAAKGGGGGMPGAAGRGEEHRPDPRLEARRPARHDPMNPDLRWPSDRLDYSPITERAPHVSRRWSS